MWGNARFCCQSIEGGTLTPQEVLEVGPKRKWFKFPGRFRENLDKNASLLGLGGILVGVVTLPILPLVAATAFIAVGGTVIVSTLGYATYRAIPPKLVSPTDMANMKVALPDLDQLEERLKNLPLSA